MILGKILQFQRRDLRRIQQPKQPSGAAWVVIGCVVLGACVYAACGWMVAP